MRNFLLVDFEFTFYKRPVGRPRGFFAEIIEIGAVKLDGATLEEAGRLANFVKPHFFPRQAKEALEFCMITEGDMKKAIEFPAMVERLGALYEAGTTYFVAWGREDYKVLSHGCEKHKLDNPILEEDYLDLAEAYRLWLGNQQTTGLKAAAEEQQVDAEGLWHTAFDDANNTGKVLKAMLAKGWTPELYFAQRAELEQQKAEATERWRNRYGH